MQHLISQRNNILWLQLLYSILLWEQLLNCCAHTNKLYRVDPWVVNHKKHKVFKIFFFIIGFVDLFLLIILVKKFFSIGQFFFMLLPKYCQNHVIILCKFPSMVFQYFRSSVTNNRGIPKISFIKMISAKSSTR